MNKTYSIPPFPSFFSILVQPFVEKLFIFDDSLMNRSNITSFSFTVQEDLISQTSLNTTFQRPKPLTTKPFTQDYGNKGMAGHTFQDQPLPTIQRRIAEQAQNQAYRELNNDLFNPFEHKLTHTFVGRQGDLYQRQKQKQIELIKKREMDMMNANRNYTIVFNNNPQQGRSLKVAANNILAQENTVPSIGDYYQQKFKKKSNPLHEISEENEETLKKDNFVGDRSTKKQQKTRESIRVQEKRATTGDKPKIVKSNDGWKKEGKSEKQIDTNSKKQPQKRGNNTPSFVPKPQKTIKQTKPQPTPIIHPKKTQQINPKRNNLSQSKLQTKKINNSKKPFSQAYQGPDRNLVQQLQKQISECPTISFDDIAELDNAKGLLQQAVLLPRMMPQFFKGIRKAMKGILLFGPPGTGKTLLAKAISCNNMFFNVSASSLASKWKGDSQKMVRILFEMARYHSPSVIFFDEIDSIATKRSQNQHESTRKVKTELLVQMDGVGNSEQSVFVLAATNRPWDLDEALRRRLQKRIYIPLPGKEGRRKMFDLNLKGLNISQKVNWQQLTQLTKGCSGADICNICRDAAYNPMRRKLAQVGGIKKISQLSQDQLMNQCITEIDLMEAARKIRPSVGNEDLKRYSDWMKQFGSS